MVSLIAAERLDALDCIAASSRVTERTIPPAPATTVITPSGDVADASNAASLSLIASSLPSSSAFSACLFLILETCHRISSMSSRLLGFVTLIPLLMAVVGFLESDPVRDPHGLGEHGLHRRLGPGGHGQYGEVSSVWRQ